IRPSLHRHAASVAQNGVALVSTRRAPLDTLYRSVLVLPQAGRGAGGAGVQSFCMGVRERGDHFNFAWSCPKRAMSLYRALGSLLFVPLLLGAQTESPPVAGSQVRFWVVAGGSIHTAQLERLTPDSLI